MPAHLSSIIENLNPESFASDSKLPLPSTLSDPDALSSASTNSANAADSERISDLTREFWDTRRQLSAASARCLVLEKHLKASEIGVFSILILLRAQLLTFFAFYSLSLITVLLTDLRKEIVESENRLLKERRERIHAETVLEDVLRECKEPAIIPALFATLIRDYGMDMVKP